MSIPIQTDAETPAVQRQRRRAGIASVAGTALEFYDFTIYGLAAALVFGKVFFPSADPAIATLSAFATFGVGFLARPVGGIIFGHIGDRYGRKNVLVITLIIMGGSTFLIGCIPSYASIGFAAPVLLVALRLLQGLAYGGEWAGAVLMSSEHASPKKRGLYAALPNTGLAVGSILGNSAMLLVSLLGQEALLSWGWRIPFWAGAALVIVGLVLRRTVSESPEFKKVESRGEVVKSPLMEVLRTHPLQILLAIGVMGGIAVTAYVTTTFSVGYATQNGIPASLVLTGSLIASGLQLFMVPFAGALSDRFGRRRMFVLGALGLGVSFFAFFPLLVSGNQVLVVLAYVVIFGGIYSFPRAIYPSLFTESFDTRLGYTGLSLGVQLGIIVGGFTPFFASLIVQASGTFALSLVVFGVLALSATCATLLVSLQHRVALKKSVATDVDRPIAESPV